MSSRLALLQRFHRGTNPVPADFQSLAWRKPAQPLLCYAAFGRAVIRFKSCRKHRHRSREPRQEHMNVVLIVFVGHERGRARSAELIERAVLALQI